jgi:hypothetical protein
MRRKFCPLSIGIRNNRVTVGEKPSGYPFKLENDIELENQNKEKERVSLFLQLNISFLFSVL